MGDFPKSTATAPKTGGGGGREELESLGVPFVEEPKATAPLDCLVAAGLQARPLDGGTPCVAAAKMEQFKPRSPTHQSPKSSR
jgi:hypothetical protein